jgi:glycosyltransferase involved in cell wall biosynthesis
MKIAIINRNDMKGGAARAAWRLYKGLRLCGQQAFMVVRHKESTDPNVVPVILANEELRLEEGKFNKIKKKFIKQNRSALSDSLFSFPYPGYDLGESSFIHGMDVINLHHIKDFQSVETVANMLNLNIPIVWTLHDQSAYTGGCHFSAGCIKFQADCRECPQLQNNSMHIPYLVLKNKLKNWSNRTNLTIVSPSRWLAEHARNSALFKHCRIEHIANGLETDVFKPIPKPLAKKRLNLNPDSMVILVGSMNLKLKRKGFEYFLDAIQCCMQDAKFAGDLRHGKIQLLSFGNYEEAHNERNFNVRAFGRIECDEKLALIYSAADLFILPSLEDNFPNSMLEALACATPVIAFQVGGIPEVVEHGETGFLVPEKNAKKMGLAILDLLTDQGARKKMAQQGAARMGKEFNLHVQAGRYAKLFESVRSHGEYSPIHSIEVPESLEIKDGRSGIDPEMYSHLRPVFAQFHIHA